MTDRKTCLIIGGRGFVGQGIAWAIRQRGWTLTAVGRADYGEYVGNEFDVVINANGNASRFRANREPLEDFEASAWSVYRSLFDFRHGTYVFVSTVDVYNDPASAAATTEAIEIDPLALCPYGFHKWLAERLVMRHGASWQIVRLAQMVGRQLKKGPVFDILHRQPLWVDEQTRLHFMNTRAVGRSLVQLIEAAPANQIYNVCGRGTVSLRQVLELLPPERGEVTHAARERQVYDVNTDKTRQFVPLPDSWDEVSVFVRQFPRPK